MLIGGLSAASVLATEPDYMTHTGPRVESAAEVDAPVDGLGRPQAPKPSADEVDPAPTASFLGDSRLDFRFRTYYLERTRNEAPDSLAWAIGGAMEYRSGLWRDRIAIGATLYTSQPLYAPDQKPGSGFVNYTVGDTPDSGDNASADKDELGFTLDWKPKNGKLGGLWLRARAALINASGPDAVDMGDFRLILNYDFSIL